MIDLETIEREINELETRRDTTYSTCERLSWLYVVRDHLLPRDEPMTDRLTGSDFLVAASSKPYAQLMAVLDEHMQALKVVQPREYEAVMERISRLQ